MNFNDIFTTFQSQGLDQEWVTEVLIELALVMGALFTAWIANRKLSQLVREQPKDNSNHFDIFYFLNRFQPYFFVFVAYIFLGIGSGISNAVLADSLVVKIAQSMFISIFVYRLLSNNIANRIKRSGAAWILIPLAILITMGWYNPVVNYLDAISFEVGNIRISAYSITRALIFGTLIFWMGRKTNDAGKRIIRNQDDIEIGTKEVIVKLFEVGIFIFIAVVILQVMGINFTTFAVFGGALGVGIGFGLQSIASNFISGMIILLDRSLTVGDYIEMDDGVQGIIRELNMRSTTLETFDGKDVMVPNEKFITSSFINWTHKNAKQRYSLNFQVSYQTDLHKLFKLLREITAAHPSVLSGPDYPFEEQPDAEISGFGDSGVDILVEYWIEAIDDGKNRVGGDLLLSYWDAFKAEGIEIPYPQREVRVLDGKSLDKN